MNLAELPANQIDAIRYFASAENCHNFLAHMRWGADAVKCAHCGSANVGNLVCSEVKSRSKTGKGKVTVRRLWNCKACKTQFTVKTGTIFEDSPLPLEKWLPAVWLLCNAKNGVSSCELARSLNVTQKTAWFMGHRIRAAMSDGGFIFSGTVEADETFVGPKAKNMHKHLRAAKGKRGGQTGMSTVMGVLERSEKKGHSRVVVDVIDKVDMETLHKNVKATVAKGSALCTDGLHFYRSLGWEYEHEFVDHAVEYVRGKVHTNGLENFWTLLKRMLRGTYVCASPMHLFRYLDEEATRFNERKTNDAGRFLSTMGRVSGRRLVWKELTGDNTDLFS